MNNRYSLVRFKNNLKRNLDNDKFNGAINLFKEAFPELPEEELFTFMFGKRSKKGLYPYPITYPEVVIIYDNVQKKVASAILTANYRGVRYIPALATYPEYRRTGFTKLLLKDAQNNMYGNTELRAHLHIKNKRIYQTSGLKVEPANYRFPRGKNKGEPVYRAILKKPK